jgi:hypothetical protein
MPEIGQTLSCFGIVKRISKKGLGKFSRSLEHNPELDGRDRELAGEG